MKTRISLWVIITALCSAAPVVQANEPEACDGQVGATYGLCTAYYDAVHCQQEPADDPADALLNYLHQGYELLSAAGEWGVEQFRRT